MEGEILRLEGVARNEEVVDELVGNSSTGLGFWVIGLWLVDGRRGSSVCSSVAGVVDRGTCGEAKRLEGAMESR